MAETRIVEHEFTLFPKSEACPMGLIVGWKACAASCGKAGAGHGCPSSSTPVLRNHIDPKILIG
jgi:hypothetical protein